MNSIVTLLCCLLAAAPALAAARASASQTPSQSASRNAAQQGTQAYTGARIIPVAGECGRVARRQREPVAEDLRGEFGNALGGR